MAFTIRCIAGSSVGAPAPFRARTAGRAVSLRKATRTGEDWRGPGRMQGEPERMRGGLGRMRGGSGRMRGGRGRMRGG